MSSHVSHIFKVAEHAQKKISSIRHFLEAVAPIRGLKMGLEGKKAYIGKNPSFWKIQPEDNVLAQSVNSTKCVVSGVLSSEYICETQIIFLGALRQNSDFLPKKPIQAKIRVF